MVLIEVGLAASAVAKVRNTASDGFKEIEGEVQKAAQKWDPKF